MDDTATTLPTGMPPDAEGTSASTTTSASPEQLWPLVSDPSTPARFSDEFRGSVWKDTPGVTPPGLGARFIGTNGAGDREWTALGTVTAYDPQRLFGWTIQSLDDPVSDWAFEVTVDDDGTTTLTHRCRMGFSSLSPLRAAMAARPEKAERIMAARLASLRENMQRTVEGIAALAEGRDPDDLGDDADADAS